MRRFEEDPKKKMRLIVVIKQVRDLFFFS